MLTCGLAATANARAGMDTRCVVASGNAAARCVRRYVEAVARCRATADVACEAAIRAADGQLASFVAATGRPVRDGCTAAAADVLTSSLGVEDLVARTAEACAKWGEDFVATAFADDLTRDTPATLACQRVVAARLARVRETAVKTYGRRCNVAELAGRRCDRTARDRRIARARDGARRQISRRCGADFDALGLVSSASGATVDERVATLVDTIVVRSRHLGLRVYPPLVLGPTALFGAQPVGVRTLMLVDPSRTNPSGTGPRALTTELLYPSTPDAVAGVARDVITLFGTPLFPTPTYRDVARAAGQFPLLIYSPGSGEPRFTSLLLMAQLASHGYVVAGIDHEGNGLLDPSGDPDTLTNRPRDVSALLDQLLALDGTPGEFLEGALDPARIAVFGHSLGGYTAYALATGPFALGTFTDPRVKAIVPLDGSAQYFPDPATFATIQVPTLLFSGSLSPLLHPLTQTVFDTILPGPQVVAYADLRDAGHASFTDVCEVPDEILGLTGPLPFECGPSALPWRYVRYVMGFLSLNFFDATLKDDAEARARLAAVPILGLEELGWQAK